MSKSFYVYSTMTADVAYTGYDQSPGGMPVRNPEKTVVIKGGANVADKRVYTPRGVVTEITEDQLNAIKEHRVFQLHKEKGFIRVEQHKTDPEKVAADMKSRDPSAPMVEQDIKDTDAQLKAEHKNKKK